MFAFSYYFEKKPVWQNPCSTSVIIMRILLIDFVASFASMFLSFVTCSSTRPLIDWLLSLANF